MKSLSLLVVLIPAAMLAAAAEPVGVDKRGPSAATAPERATKNASAAPRRRTATAQASILSTDTLAMLPAPGVLFPDLVPRGVRFVASCGWNEAAGETCETACPPTYADLAYGTRNASNRALSGAGKVKVFLKSTGALVREYPMNGLAAQGEFLPGKVRRKIVFCSNTTSVGSPPPATHDLVVETAANEVSKNNNKSEFHVAPDEQLLP
jgi:hypothetical protein